MSSEELPVGEIAKNIVDILVTIKCAGLAIQEGYCSATSDGPIMFPPVPQQPFIDAFPEGGLTDKERLEKKQQGEHDAEIVVYRALEDIDCRMTVLPTFKYTHQQYQRFVGLHTCKCESPCDDEGECDFVILYGNIVAIMEIKAPELSGKNSDKLFGRHLSKSMEQRDRTRLLIDGMSNIINADKPPIILEFSVFNRVDRTAAESFASYRNISEEEKNRIVLKDDIADFSKWWDDKVVPHFQSVERCSTSPNLQTIIMGLWCVDNKNNYNTDKCDLSYWITEIDKSLRSAVLSRKPEAPISSDIKGAPKFFKDHLKIKCITDAQKSIFNAKETRLFICGPAGSGKTVLILAKVIQLVLKYKTEQKIVLYVAGETSAEYYKHELVNALGSVVSIGEIMYSEAAQQVQQIQDRGEQVAVLWRHVAGSWSTVEYLHALLDTGYHTFIDDMQDMFNSGIPNDNVEMCDAVTRVLSNQLPAAGTSNRVVWFATDLMQDMDVLTFGTSHQFGKSYSKIPIDSIMYLSSNLRNTLEISNALAVIREGIIRIESKASMSSEHFIKIAPSQIPGHYIHGPKPRMNYVVTTESNIANMVRKIVSYELDKLCSTSKQLGYNDIALVYNNWYYKYYGDGNIRLPDLLLEISSNYVSVSDTQTIQVCSVEKASSAEWSAVIALVILVDSTLYDNPDYDITVDYTHYLSTLYKAMSRGRVFSSVVVVASQTFIDRYKDLIKELGTFVNIKYHYS